MNCNGVCNQFKAKKIPLKSRYSEGQKFCNLCCMYIKYDGNSCPCCSSNLRTMPRDAKSKQLYIENTAMTRI